MKKIFPLIIIFYLLISVAGCGNNGVTNPLAGNVTFTMSSQSGQNGGIDFLAKPSVDVKLTRVISKLGTFADTIAPAANYVFSKDSFYVINEYNGVASGQQWTFYFTGATNAGNSSFDVTTNYTVP